MKIKNIKFKAKRLDGKGWAIGDLLHSYENGAIIVPIEGGGAFSVVHSTVCQFTGLKDENGEDLYENDIVSLLESKRIVAWDEVFCGFILEDIEGQDYFVYCDELKDHAFQIIGNKFDKENSV